MGGCYRANLPAEVYYGITFRDLFRLDNIALQKKRFLIRGKYEIEALKNVKNVMGRTEFDYAAVKRINPSIQYFYCPENLRREFSDIEKFWNFNGCRKHSLFMSQATYPIKGLHLALEALRDLAAEYPDIILYVAGENITKVTTWKNRIRISNYGKYIRNLIKKWNLRQHICFVGNLNAEQMKEQYLRTNVYILPSVMENSPNSLCEAMSLGVPCVAADVGGVSSMMTHKKEGYLYPASETYQLTNYIRKIFENDDFTREMSENSIERMKKYNRIEENIVLLKEIYEEIYKRGNMI